MDPKPIYLDYNATTPVDPAAVEAMLPYFTEQFGNPSSAHPYGWEARRAVDRARAQLAALIRAAPGEIVFTSGGTEANNMAIKGVAEREDRRSHIITSAVEHPAVLEPCAWLAKRSYDVTVLPVDGYGMVDPAAVEAALRPNTILVSIMLANNEVGTIQPIAEIAALAHARGVLVHTDAAQAVGKIPVDVGVLGVDLLSVAGHKLYAPKGVGALYIRHGVTLAPLMHGASHEHGRRPGTENVPYLAALGAAAVLAGRDLPATMRHMADMRDRLYEHLRDRLSGLRRNGHPDHSLPNTLSVGFTGVEADALLARIADRVAASAGAACHADSVTVSPILRAMHVPLPAAKGTLRLSTGRYTTADEVDTAADVIARAVGVLRVGR
jgi:cysteine desulfurase